MSECSLGVALHTLSHQSSKQENKEGTIGIKAKDRPFVFVYDQEIFYLAPGIINKFTFNSADSDDSFQFIIEN